MTQQSDNLHQQSQKQPEPIPPMVEENAMAQGRRFRQPVKVNILVSSQKSSSTRKKSQPKEEPGPNSNRDRPKVNILVSSQPKLDAQPPASIQPVDVTSDRLDEDAFDDGEWEDEFDDDAPRVKVVVATRDRRRWKKILTRVLTLSLILGMAGSVAGGGWIALKLILNPGSVGWLSWMLPEWNRNPLTREVIQTRKEIEIEAAKAGLSVGEPLYLGADSKDVLIPILSLSSSCQEGTIAVAYSASSASCGQIAEIRAYRLLSPMDGRSHRRESTYLLLDRLAVQGPAESFVIAPFVTTPSTSPGSSRSLPLTHVSLIQGQAAASGAWLHISGERSQGSTQNLYGQIIWYDPDQSRLVEMEPWTSSAGQMPEWKDITGNETTELVVNQSVGLEPHFQVYQLKSGQSVGEPFQLEAIALDRPAFQDWTYDNGLRLAQSRLWSPALELVELAKQRHPDQWTDPAQAQLDVISLHAQVTAAQAERDWASPGQSVLAHLIDGRWTSALSLLQAAIRDGYEVNDLFVSDASQVWNRINAVLNVNPNRTDVQIWGALVTAIQRDRTAALSWLGQQRPTATTSRQVQQLINLIENPQGVPATVTASVNPMARLVGSASPIADVDATDWRRSQTNLPLTLGENEVWYQVEVSDFYDGQRWRRSPFNDLTLPQAGATQRLWSLLGLENSSQIQLIDAESLQAQGLTATVKAARLRGGSLQLLVAGPAPSDPASGLLAMTSSTLSWIQPNYSMTLTDLSQQWPIWGPVVAATLWNELQQQGRVVPVSHPNSEALLADIGAWSVQLIDVTGSGQPDAIFTFQPDLLPASQSTLPVASSNLGDGSQTLIISDLGVLIYSELGAQSGQTLMAITEVGDRAPALLIKRGQTYTLQHWSEQHRRFQ